MTDLLTRLRRLTHPIQVAVIGIGNIGRGIAYQVGATPGMRCAAIADIRLDEALAWAARLGRDHQVVESLPQLHDAIRGGRLAVCADGELLAQCELIDVLVDASSAILGGLQFAQTAIRHHKHVVMMNCEADLLFGPYLLQQAQREGVVYTSADGDQHTCLKRLINEIELWGFRTVLAGNMKGYLDRLSNPTRILPEAQKRFMDPKMCASYTDGTKLCVEMALIANGIGGRTVVPGMLGPRLGDIYRVFDHFDFEALWDGATPLVDYVLGVNPPGGVFVVGFTDHPHQMETLGWYPPRLGPGPFYVFHRPYHLGHFEIAAGIAEAFLDGWALLQPTHGMLTDVVAYAKQDLRQGDVLDGIGGYTLYGLIENCADQPDSPGLPICLAEDVTLRRDVRQGERLQLDDVLYDPASAVFDAYRQARQIGALT